MPGEMTSLVDLNDADILRLEKVLRILNARQGTNVNLEHFRKEALERFGEAGFKVDVKTYATGRPGVYAFDIEIVERLEGQFDPEQMAHEVQTNLLGIGQEGVIKGSKLWTPPSRTHVSR